MAKKPRPTKTEVEEPKPQDQRIISPMARICDRLEQGVRATIPIFVVTERLLILFGCLLLLAIFLPLGAVEAKALLGLAGTSLNVVGVIAYKMHVGAIHRAEMWAGFIEAYRDPNITEGDVEQLDALVLGHVRSETQNDRSRGIAGIFKSRTAAATQ